MLPRLIENITKKKAKKEVENEKVLKDAHAKKQTLLEQSQEALKEKIKAQKEEEEQQEKEEEEKKKAQQAQIEKELQEQEE